MAAMNRSLRMRPIPGRQGGLVRRRGPGAPDLDRAAARQGRRARPRHLRAGGAAAGRAGR